VRIVTMVNDCVCGHIWCIVWSKKRLFIFTPTSVNVAYVDFNEPVVTLFGPPCISVVSGRTAGQLQWSSDWQTY